MLHYVCQLVSNCVCLRFGAEQVVYSGFLELLTENSCLIHLELMKVLRQTQNSEVVNFSPLLQSF